MQRQFIEIWESAGTRRNRAYRTENAGVGGSIPPLGTNFFRKAPADDAEF
jgi:hypothetical protein